MNSIKFLIAAYVATWVIHGSYIATLVKRFRRLQREIEEMGQRK